MMKFKSKIIAVICTVVMVLTSLSALCSGSFIFADSSKTEDNCILLDSSFESGSFGNGWGIVNDHEKDPEILRGISNSGKYLVLMNGPTASITQSWLA